MCGHSIPTVLVPAVSTEPMPFFMYPFHTCWPHPLPWQYKSSHVPPPHVFTSPSPLTRSVGLLLLVVYYSYAILGMEFLSGKVFPGCWWVPGVLAKSDTDLRSLVLNLYIHMLVIHSYPSWNCIVWDFPYTA